MSVTVPPLGVAVCLFLSLSVRVPPHGVCVCDCLGQGLDGLVPLSYLLGLFDRPSSAVNTPARRTPVAAPTAATVASSPGMPVSVKRECVRESAGLRV